MYTETLPVVYLEIQFNWWSVYSQVTRHGSQGLEPRSESSCEALSPRAPQKHLELQGTLHGVSALGDPGREQQRPAILGSAWETLI